jgi:GNAT superfamily N-acetyltransferase
MADGDERSMHETEDVELIDVVGGPRLDDVRTLFHAYGEEISRDAGAREVLDVQRFEDEVVQLPGEYAPPHGVLLAALVDDVAAACIALRPSGPGVAEMKRLYVSPDYRGRSLGFKLVESLIARAESLGYERIRLDTLPFMRGATKLYRAFEFVEIPAYRENRMPGARFFELELGKAGR